MRIYTCLLWATVAVLFTAEEALAQVEYYVATDGDDQINPGTIDLPFATIQKAIDLATAGTTIHVRGGTYQHNTGPTETTAILIEGKSGTQADPIRLFAYPGEEVILDFSAMAYLGEQNMVGLKMIDADWWHLKGLQLANVPAPPFQSVDGKTGNGFTAHHVNNCIFEQLQAHGNHGTGFRLYGASTNNLYLNCDAFSNIDDQHPEPGQNADGMALAFMSSTATGNVVRGCRTWWNGDDGIDMWQAEAAITVEGSWSFWNGYYPGTTDPAGNGNGIKLGVNVGGPRHVVRHNLVFENRNKGVDDNYAVGAQDWFNNTAFANGDSSFVNSVEGVEHLVRNNIQVGPEIDFQDAVDHQHNSWNSSMGVIANDFDFLSVSSAGVDGPRGPDGSLPETDFLRLAPGSDLIDVGVDVGLPFLGSAPDLGAYEAGCEASLADCIGPLHSDCETDTLSDNDHCGGCGAPCFADQVCTDGVCLLACPAEQAECSGACVDLETDPGYCGDCTTRCAADQVCEAGHCIDPCAGATCYDSGTVVGDGGIADAGRVVDAGRGVDAAQCTGPCAAPDAGRDGGCHIGGTGPKVGSWGYLLLLGLVAGRLGRRRSRSGRRSSASPDKR